mmetsp:Transcript_10809/g.14030  ORF Transcript_10809/g.14030 Transcript_10809/m.14030 type:complete len:676 (+) Transcript_10809:131-2158(+)
MPHNQYQPHRPFAEEMYGTVTQIAILAAIIMLSVDSLNPIKFVCETLDLPTAYAAYPSAIVLIYTICSNIFSITYYCTKIFFVSIVSIFFKEIEVIGRANVPRQGPIIFTGNHANQFVDALMVLCNCSHKVGFLIAMKSWKQLVVGTFARCLGCIPVERPQDLAKKGKGMMTAVGIEVTGEGTAFTKLGVGDKLRFKGESNQYRIAAIHSDDYLTLKEPYEIPEGMDEADAARPRAFDVLANVDHAHTFGRVFDSMKNGACIGIFPEGGSHDRTDLLPLKAGVSIISFGCLETHNLAVPVVPIGLNYFRRNRFRGRAVVEFGPPIYVPEALMDKYREGDTKAAYNEFLGMVKDGMRATLVTAPDENALNLIHMARRLWLPTGYIPGNKEKQDLNRRFAEGYRILLEKYAETGESNETSNKAMIQGQMEDLRLRLLDYCTQISKLGLSDYQVPTLPQQTFVKILYNLLHLFFAFSLSSIPSLLLNAPVGIFAKWVAEKHRKKALAGSRVKIQAVDVMLSKKIVISIVMVPTLWMTYAVLLYFFTPLDLASVTVAVMCFPIFSYIGIMATEAGMVSLKDLRPALLRLFSPKARNKMEQLPAVRSQLRKDLKDFIKTYGPNLGPVYDSSPEEWDQYVRKSASSTNLAEMLQHEKMQNPFTEAKENHSKTQNGALKKKK